MRTPDRLSWAMSTSGLASGASKWSLQGELARLAYFDYDAARISPNPMKATQVVFITGASTGIGRALALELASQGCRLALTARRQELLDELAQAVERAGGQALALSCDVTEQAQVNRAVEATMQRFGRIDWAILSAGISQPTDAATFQAAELAHLLKTNLLGVAYCLEALIPQMRRQGAGKIAALSSLAGDRGIPGSAGYCATKAALNALFDGLRSGLRPHEIELVTIAPGYVQTPMTEKFGKLPYVMSAAAAAQLIVERMARGERLIRFPWQAAWVMWGLRLMPVRWFDALTAKYLPVRLKEPAAGHDGSGR
jgi:NAD(P)-dependent dehydrogenase (short-subunit alcohol dehydrogenase family)